MKVLVTGGAGFIASHIVDLLIESNYKVVILDNLSTGKMEYVNKKAKFYKGDIVDKQKLNKIFTIEKPDCVIHHAAQIDVQKSLKNPSHDALINIIGSINLLECCRDFGIIKFIYASSAAIYGNPDTIPVDLKHKIDPISFYGISKHTPEHYIKVFSELYNFNYTVLRYSNVYGIRQDPKGEGGVISIFMDKYLNNELPTVYGDGEQTRDFIYVKDVARANIEALKYDGNGVFNVSLNKSITINELIKIMNRISNKDFKAVYKEERSGDIRHSRLDNTLTLETLKWQPEFSLEDGLKITYDYYIKKAVREVIS